MNASQKTLIRMHVRFIIRKARINRMGTCPINCRITINNVKANEFSVGIQVEPEKWDSKAQRLKGSSNRALDSNRRLDVIKAELEELFMNVRSKGGNVSATYIKDLYTNKIETLLTIERMGEKCIEWLKIKDRSKTTIIRYRRCYKYLADYVGKNRPADSIQKNQVSGFWAHLKKKGYHNDYCNKILQSCIGLYKYGQREGLIENNPFSGVSLEWKKELDLTCLTLDEVDSMRNGKWSERSQRVVDSFLFMCYTGLHISDYQDVREESTYSQGDWEFMKIRRVKTGVQALIPLLPETKRLINKYGGINELPRISGQKSNDYLKLIAEKLGIEKNITNKIARKTFTNMFLNHYNFSFEAVALMLGHTTTKQVKHYGAINETRLISELTQNMISPS